MKSKSTIKLLMMSLAMLLAGCDTAPQTYQYSQPQITPLQACFGEARRDASICELAALGSVKSGVPDSYHQCGARRLIQEDRCRERFDPNYVRRTNPAPQAVAPAPQQRAVQPAMKPSLVRQWIGRNAERFCQYSDGSVKNVGYDLCEF